MSTSNLSDETKTEQVNAEVTTKIDPKELFPMIKAGRYFTKGGALHTAITSGRRFQETVDASRLGVPFQVIAAPIKTIESFTEQIEQVSAVSEEQAANIGEIAVALDNLRTVAVKLNESAKQINISL